MAVMVRSGSAAHLRNALASGFQNTRTAWSSLGSWSASDPLGGRRQVQDQGQGSLIFFLCFAIKSFHLQQNFPHCLLGSSISTVSGVPIHAILLLPLRSLRCSWHSSVSGRTSSYKLVAAICHSAPPSLETPRFSSCSFCQMQGNFWVEAVASHSSFSSCTIFPNRTLLALVRNPLISSIPHFPKACPPNYAHPHHMGGSSPWTRPWAPGCGDTLKALAGDQRPI